MTRMNDGVVADIGGGPDILGAMVTRKLTPRSKKPKRASARARRPKTSPTLDWITALAKNIPPEEQARHPIDGAANEHHYLHGSAKQD